MLGERVISTDEKSGIQALERIAPTKPPRPGLIERIEGEYKRHGTLCLTANFEVATGEIASYTIGPTRTELNFADHIERTIAEDPGAPWTPRVVRRKVGRTFPRHRTRVWSRREEFRNSLWPGRPTRPDRSGVEGQPDGEGRARGPLRRRRRRGQT